MTLERTIARISRDDARAIAFHIVLDGDSETLVARPGKRQDASRRRRPRGRLRAFSSSIPHLSFDDAHRCLREIVQLIADAFGEQAGVRGSKPALARAITFDAARRFVQANLTEFDFSPERVVESLALSRATIYRLFQHEGGLHAYIRHLRLRAAANDLVRFPRVPVTEIAFSVGFNSASDFTRAFRRAYGFAPQEIRTYLDGFPGKHP